MIIDLANNDPIDDMQQVLRDAGRTHFTRDNAWESTLCILSRILIPKLHVNRLLGALPLENRILNELDVQNIIANLGYTTHVISDDNKTPDARLLPCLYITHDNKPLLILNTQNNQYAVWHDGEKRIYSPESLPPTQDIIWLFRHIDENMNATSKFMREGTGFGWFRALFQRFSTTITVIMGTGFVLNLLALATPLFIMIVYDRVIGAGNLNSLFMLTVGATGAMGLEWLFRRIRNQALAWLSARLDNIVGNAVFAHLIGLPPAMIERASIAAQIARIKTFESIRDFFAGPVFLSVIEIPFVVISAIAIFLIAGPLVLVPILMTVCFCLLFWTILQRVRVTIRLAAKASSTSQQFSIQTFEKIRAIKCNGLTELWYEKYRDLTGREMMAQMHLNWQGIMAETLSNSLITLSVVLTAVVGTHLVWAGTLSTGALVATMILVWRVLTPFHSLASMVPRLEQLRNSILQIDKLMDMDPEHITNAQSAVLPFIRGNLQFTNATCAFENADPVFTDLNITINAGDFVTITGDNGAGKSTLLKIIKRMNDLSSGTLRLDGFNIRQLRPDFLRDSIAYVSQQPAVFNTTILDNLRLGNPTCTEKQAEDALKLADAWEDIRHLPDGINNPVPNIHDSNMASRIALARAYLKDSSILLIDEIPNTILCGPAGRHLRDYIIRNKGRRTIIMVTYREDFIRLSDKTILLSIGKPAHTGTPNDIVNTIRKRQAA